MGPQAAGVRGRIDSRAWQPASYQRHDSLFFVDGLEISQLIDAVLLVDCVDFVLGNGLFSCGWCCIGGRVYLMVYDTKAGVLLRCPHL